MEASDVTSSAETCGAWRPRSRSRGDDTTVKQNLFWAFVYNVVGIPVAAGVCTRSPACCFAGDRERGESLSSVSVVANSLRHAPLPRGRGSE